MSGEMNLDETEQKTMTFLSRYLSGQTSPHNVPTNFAR